MATHKGTQEDQPVHGDWNQEDKVVYEFLATEGAEVKQEQVASGEAEDEVKPNRVGEPVE